jgi:hypothetical protein
MEARAEGRAMTSPPVEKPEAGLYGAVAARVRTWLRELPTQLHCLVHGHTEECLIEVDRIVLRCVKCGRRSPGWRIYSER